jgi:hypothetical protein
MKTDNRSFENLTECKYLVTAVTDPNDALQKIKEADSVQRTACHCSFQWLPVLNMVINLWVC